MAASFAMHTARMHVQQQQQIDSQLSKTPVVACTCGAQAFRDQFTQDRQRLRKRVTPTGSLSTTNEKDDALRSAKAHVKSQSHNDDDALSPAARKRSFWRKLLGKGPKCICAQLQRERDAQKAQPIPLPSEYDGCVSVRVAGKQVPYTREMQLLKRRSYTPLDAISEDED